MNPAVVSLKGYADVNRELLSSVSEATRAYWPTFVYTYHFVTSLCQSIGTITIYLIVLLQFKLSLVTQQIPPSLHAQIAAHA